MNVQNTINVRPYQMMCLICRLGKQNGDAYYFERKLDILQNAIKQDRDVPISLRLNVESTFRFQNPGHRYDTPEGKLFNISRDLNIIQRLGLLPGTIIPASDLIRVFSDNIVSTDGICSLANGTVNCKACKFAKAGNYERVINTCYDSLIQARSEEELSVCKKITAEKLYKKKRLDIRPHHLMCLACHAGDKKTEDVKYLTEDHLFEVIEICRNNPEIPIRLIQGPCMICAPCPGYFPDNGFCSKSFGIGLRDQKKDIDLLLALDLNYGDTLPAYKLFDRLFEEISSTAQICGFQNTIKTGPAWRVCGGENNPDGCLEFKKARKTGLMIPGVKPRSD
jgi:hypothetical protein